MAWHNPDIGLAAWAEPDSWSRGLSKPGTLTVGVKPEDEVASWPQPPAPATVKGQFTATEWYIECQYHGLTALEHVIEVNPKRRGGVPVLRGTGFTVAQIFAELAETKAVEEIAREFDLDADKIRELLRGFSLTMQRPYGK